MLCANLYRSFAGWLFAGSLKADNAWLHFAPPLFSLLIKWHFH